MSRTRLFSDEMWARVDPLLPDRSPRRGGRWGDHRAVVEAICWRFRTGSPWRDLPKDFPAWQTVWWRFDRWANDGTWDGILVVLQGDAHAAEQLEWLVSAIAGCACCSRKPYVPSLWGAPFSNASRIASGGVSLAVMPTISRGKSKRIPKTVIATPTVRKIRQNGSIRTSTVAFTTVLSKESDHLEHGQKSDDGQTGQAAVQLAE